MALDDEPAVAIPGSSTHSAHTSQNTRPRIRENDFIVTAGSIATARASTIYTELIRRSPFVRQTVATASRRVPSVATPYTKCATNDCRCFSGERCSVERDRPSTGMAISSAVSHNAVPSPRPVPGLLPRYITYNA